ncbi:sulfotransferase [Desulfobulbus alkaliphilus]|nr:sulfotransferase [Desulfobulbus alkaliphilus]
MNQNRPNNQVTIGAPFEPVFIVGAPRSGTTMLAVLLDRHPRIAIPPETQFFTDFLPDTKKAEQATSHQHKLNAALAHPRLRDLELEFDEVLPLFQRCQNTYEDLFRTLLEAYARKKGAVRVGEKSPKHIEHVPNLLHTFPRAKVICIVRDGRDVVHSLLKVPWAEPNNPRRFGLFCAEWNEYARMALHYKMNIPATQFILVRYEDILRTPEASLKALCSFINESYTPEMLTPQQHTEAVPSWEMEWKSKASQVLDPERVEAWRRHPDERVIWRMNAMMGSLLREFGYAKPSSSGCPLHLRLVHALQNLPYRPEIRPLSLLGLRLLRRCRLVQQPKR